MSREGAVEVRDVWKRFRTTRTRMLFRDQIEALNARIRGTSPAFRWQWALRDISFEIAPGEAVGLIGANGSGKSTLLKLLTEVMYPYAGQINVHGRVGALIEVRAGIHPDLTGRENIFLYGSLLGLGRRGVAAKFDEIVDFAELDEAIDRQVKFYSSGMQMRLGFAVAAFLEPNVLLVDEVLAVGDASFQQKCLDRMRQVIAQGTTLVFVSHDLASVEATCTRGIWLNRGVLAATGPIDQVLRKYRHAIEERIVLQSDHDGPVRVIKAEASGPDGGHPVTQAPLEITVVAEAQEVQLARLFLGISEGPPTPIFVLGRDMHLRAGQTEIRCRIANLPVARGTYYLWASLIGGGTELLPWQPVGQLEVAGPELDPAPPAVVRLAPIHVNGSWEIGGH
jgi:ABC-type polysaccharide/polyol phosphate transport system ATPase subunit